MNLGKVNEITEPEVLAKAEELCNIPGHRLKYFIGITKRDEIMLVSPEIGIWFWDKSESGFVLISLKNHTLTPSYEPKKHLQEVVNALLS